MAYKTCQCTISREEVLCQQTFTSCVNESVGKRLYMLTSADHEMIISRAETHEEFRTAPRLKVQGINRKLTLCTHTNSLWIFRIISQTTEMLTNTSSQVAGNSAWTCSAVGFISGRKKTKRHDRNRLENVSLLHEWMIFPEVDGLHKIK